MQQAKSTLWFDSVLQGLILYKNFERSLGLEQMIDVLRLTIAGRSTKCPKQWSKALHVSSNKAAVVTFLVDEWQRVAMPL